MEHGPSTLVLYLGNPIVGRDQIGLRLGHRLRRELGSHPRLQMREFVGSPLDLVTDLGGFDSLVIVDSVSGTGAPVGGVRVYSRDEILSSAAGIHIHAMNRADALLAAGRLELELPSNIRLIGIEVGEFGEDMGPELERGFEAIYARVQEELVKVLGWPAKPRGTRVDAVRTQGAYWRCTMNDDTLGRLREAARLTFEGTDVFLAYAFGSRTREAESEASDLDVGYYLAPVRARSLPIAVEMAFADRLSRQLKVEVDLRDLGLAPLEIRGRVLETGVRIFCSDEPARVRLEADLLSRYHDYKEELEAFHEHRLRSLASRKP